MAAYNTNTLASLYRKARGIGENALSMLTSGFAEPAAGYAATAAAATGYDAEGARDAIRERMTYAPKTAEGVRYMSELARVMSAVNNSAPVTTWKKGVDIAGRYSPTAGAVLASVPTAIGVATGAKPALKQGRSISMLARRMQDGMVRNAMTPRTLHPQAGVIDMLTTKPGQFVRDTKTGEIYEYQGPSPSSSGRALVVDESMAKRTTDAQKKASYGFSIDPERLDIYNKKTKTPPATEDLLDLYHGSGLHDQEFLDVVDDPHRGGFNYGAVFASPEKEASLSHGGKLYGTSINRRDVLYGGSAAYNTSDRKIQTALRDVVGKLDKDTMDLAYEAIVLDKAIGDEGLRRVFGNGYPDHEYGLAQQAARAKFAGKLGYKAVSTNDEHGTSYMILPGRRLERVKE